MISSALMAGFIAAQKTEYVGGFAGQVSGLIKEIKPARQIVEDMVEEAVDILTRRIPENIIAK
jgi:NAD(P)H-dependent flavin oxidoreductase YrpB (nitropropane dioxygenase family)